MYKGRGTGFIDCITDIKTTFVDNSAKTTESLDNEFICEDTNDKVFLPSYKDYLNSSFGFSTNTNGSSTRQCKTTDWARAYNSGTGNGNYWTRSQSKNGAGYAMYVKPSGIITYGNVVSTYQCARPAITIQID